MGPLDFAASSPEPASISIPPLSQKSALNTEIKIFSDPNANGTQVITLRVSLPKDQRSSQVLSKMASKTLDPIKTLPSSSTLQDLVQAVYMTNVTSVYASLYPDKIVVQYQFDDGTTTEIVTPFDASIQQQAYARLRDQIYAVPVKNEDLFKDMINTFLARGMKKTASNRQFIIEEKELTTDKELQPIADAIQNIPGRMICGDIIDRGQGEIEIVFKYHLSINDFETTFTLLCKDKDSTDRVVMLKDIMKAKYPSCQVAMVDAYSKHVQAIPTLFDELVDALTNQLKATQHTPRTFTLSAGTDLAVLGKAIDAIAGRFKCRSMVAKPDHIELTFEYDNVDPVVGVVRTTFFLYCPEGNTESKIESIRGAMKTTFPECAAESRSPQLSPIPSSQYNVLQSNSPARVRSILRSPAMRYNITPKRVRFSQ